MTVAMVVGAVLATAVLLAWWRLAQWWQAAPAPRRSNGWRLAVLAVGQPIAALLLFLTLFPPHVAAPEAIALTVATHATPGFAALAAGPDFVALPEAAAPAGTPTAPDLATALRRTPGVGRLRILGDGLEPRDVDAARGLAVSFAPPPLPRGLVALAAPERVAAGGAFRVGGEASGMRGTAELLDPGGTRLAIAPLDGAGRFVLTGAARVAGPALFRVRLRAADGATVEDAAVPVVTVSDPAVRVLFLAGAPGPEVKYWRRWAVDAGLAATVRQAVGGGLVLGDPVPPLSSAMLARYDLAIVDDRSWATLGPGERGALAAAVRGGLGLLLRATGPLDAGVRAGWAGLGMPVSDGTATATVRPGDRSEPELTRRVLPLATPRLVPLLHDASGAVLAGWRAVGRGRIGLWSVVDDFALVTSGHGERFGAQWGETVGTLARARTATPARVAPLPQAGRRTSLCGAGEGAVVVAPDGRATALLPDAAAGGCAGFWPRAAGWHVLRRGSPMPFYVYPLAALPGIRAVERRDATLALSNVAAAQRPSQAALRPSPSWPWLIAFMVIAAGLWYCERAPWGRSVAPIVATGRPRGR